ncbi:inosine-uridine preferring nucleoside hydrolase family protein [Asticcacaulis biprosthecium C19]|uniref:Inosine-uridine preferring nucleoside hydrolase family protein n=1 Tax=Asticcacaulis biprosthecium C19 TaxID=715226 RepID=F4QMS0_9CAUL|nr:inosine-uridine preferring nucleoside hydrolase family protein [Asticcacaulis biprosthecium C19]
MPLHHTLNNARKILELSGRSDVKLFAGSDRPLRQVLVTAEHVHGETGLDGPDLPDPTYPVQTQSGVDFIIETLRTIDDVTLVTLGPLTDVAKAFQQAPDVVSRVREVVMMLGAWRELGNVTPTAEFNAYVDPDAVDIVLNSGAPLTLLPLDATHKVLSTQDRLQVLRDMGNTAGPQAAIMLKASERFDIQKFGWAGAPLHDPCTIAYLLKPDLFTGRAVNVSVETQSTLTLGMTVVDWFKATDRPANVNFIHDAEAVGFYNLLFERLRRLP